MSDPLSTDEAKALRDAVRGLLVKRSDVRAAVETPLGYDDKLWSVLCEQIGVAALAIPQEYGGAGASLAEVCVVQHELGRTLTPSPMLGSPVLAALAVLATGRPEVCERLLPGIADGSRVAAVAWSGADGDWAVGTPALTVHGGRLSGSAHYVLDGAVADVLLAVARDDDGPGLYEVDLEDAGLRRRDAGALDPTRGLASVEAADVPARRLDTGGYAPALATVRDRVLVALAAEQVGAAERALELTVGYSTQRRQFGRPIGSFQALKHRMADAFVRLEAARSACHAAMLSARDGTPEAAADAAVAKVVCSEALQHVAAEMIQLHGGIAITWEHDAHLYFKRAHGSAELFGTPQRYVDALAGAARVG